MRSPLFLFVCVALPLSAACSAFTGVDSDGLVASGDGGSDGDGGKSRDSGSRDSGSRDSGVSRFDSGSTDGLGPECTTLQSCCDFLDTTTAASCRVTALDANESSCDVSLTEYQNDGFCTDVAPPPPPPFDSGTPPPPPPIDAGLGSDFCSLLINCCSTSGDITCLTTALGGDESACETEYASQILAGTCAP
jgi:hypothetical protein